MKNIDVKSEHAYSVCVNTNWHEELLILMRDRTRVAIIVSEDMVSALGTFPTLDTKISIFPIPDGEAGKTFSTLHSLWNWLGAAGFTRSDLVVGIGGGATTDIAGFAAATWLRGLDWVAIPTTLAGMVDAAVGGKTGMNSDVGKNLIGSFHSPIKVLIDLGWLPSLSDRDFSAGLAEVVKCGFIADREILDLVEGKSVHEIRNDVLCVEELISRSVTLKASVVSNDFQESFTREILNYGHTLGHAVEIDSAYSLRHGEAVSIGMVYVAELACESGVLSREIVERHRSILSALNLPISYPKIAWESLLRNMAMDKKSRGNAIRFVAISDIGITLRLENLSNEVLRGAYEKIST